MKKLLKITLSLVMALTLFGCGGKEKVDYTQLVIDALNKTAELQHQDVSMNVKMNFMDMELEMPMQTKVVCKDNIPTEMSVNMDMMGQETIMLYADDYMYMDIAGAKIKSKTSMEEFIKLNGAYNFTASSDTILSAEEVSEGSYKVKLSDETVNYLTEQLSSSLGENESVTPKNISYIININEDEYVSGFNVAMDFTISTEGLSIDVTAEINASYNNIGEEFEITAPKDADSYEDIDFEELMAL